MNIFKRVFKKLNAVSLIAALTLGVGAAIAMNTVSAQSCVSLPNGPFDGPGNSVIGGGAPNIPTIQKAYGTDVTVRDVYNYFGITTNDVNNLCNTAVAGTIYKNGDVYVGSHLVATNAITAGRQNISGSTPVTYNGFTFYTRPPRVSFGSNSIQAYIVMQNGQFKFGIMNACGNAFSAQPTPPSQGTLACQNLILNVGTTDSKGNQTDTLTASATATNATISSYVFDFGNGKTQTVTTNAGSVKSESQTYAPGNYTAKVTVSGVANDQFSIAPKSVTCTVPIKVLPNGSLVCTTLTLNPISTDNKTGDRTYTLTAQATPNNATISGFTFHFGDSANTTQAVSTTTNKATSKQFVYKAGVTYNNIFATVTGTGANGTALTSSSCKGNLTVPPQTCATGSTAPECQPTCTAPNGQKYPVNSPQCHPTCVSPTTGQTFPAGSEQCQPVKPAAQLINTGPGSTIGLFFGTTILAAYLHHFFTKRRLAPEVE